MIKKGYFLLLVFFGFLSCRNEPIIEHHDNGAVWKEYYLKDNKLSNIYKEYFTNGKLKLIHRYKDNKRIDSSIYYYKTPVEKIKQIIYWNVNDRDSLAKQIGFSVNGKKSKEGNLLNLGLDSLSAIGNWKYFDDEGRLKSVREYKNIDKKSYLNQEWDFNNKGDTLFYPTHYFDIIKTKDTFALNYPFRAGAIIGLPIFKEKESEIYVVVPKSGFNFNKDFSNEKEIELDTFYNLTKDIKNQRWFPNDDFSLTVAFGKKFTSTGKHIVRGYIVEYYEQEPDSIGVIKEEHKKYFEIPIYVKDTIE
tara:strand:+ start:94 stop:1008 length:915 start_codon:yes stop_codon:yes gene_type:complete